MDDLSAKPASVGWPVLLVTALVLVLGPVGAIVTSLVGCRRPWASQLGCFAVTALLVHILLLFIALPNFLVKPEYTDDRLVHDMVTIRLALERYAIDNSGYYPSEIHELQHEGYLAVFPENPFTRHNPMEPMPLAADAPPGNFTYIPVALLALVDGKAGSYYLLGYGKCKLKAPPPDLRIPVNTVYLSASGTEATWRDQPALRSLIMQLAGVLNTRGGNHFNRGRSSV